jgi:hypothetical protein
LIPQLALEYGKETTTKPGGREDEGVKDGEAEEDEGDKEEVAAERYEAAVRAVEMTEKPPRQEKSGHPDISPIISMSTRSKITLSASVTLELYTASKTCIGTSMPTM